MSLGYPSSGVDRRVPARPAVGGLHSSFSIFVFASRPFLCYHRLVSVSGQVCLYGFAILHARLLSVVETTLVQELKRACSGILSRVFYARGGVTERRPVGCGVSSALDRRHAASSFRSVNSYGSKEFVSILKEFVYGCFKPFLHYHRSLVLKGGKRRLGFGLAVAVSLLCSVAIPVPVMGFWTPHWPSLYSLGGGSSRHLLGLGDGFKRCVVLCTDWALVAIARL
ncbi:hypothetical protein YC2023_018861 [Brassica napus]